MSTYYNNKSVIGGPPDKIVLDQLKKRSDLLKKGSVNTSRSTEDLLLLNSNTGWVRMMSSVDTFDTTTSKYSSDLAQKYVMLGGALYRGKNSFQKREGYNQTGKTITELSSYEMSSIGGVVAMPGITAFAVQSKNQFGTLRVGTVEFQANSIEQLSDLERLFLRPGFSVLVEWGHSVYINNKGERVNGHPGISPKEFFTIKSKKEIAKRVLEEKEKCDGNYDAVFAFIKNFTWSYSKYGTYDCKVDFVSMGEIVESLKVIIDPNSTSFADSGTTSEDTNQNENTTPLHQFLYAIKNKSSDGSLTKPVEKKLTILEEGLKDAGKSVKSHRFLRSIAPEATENNSSPSPYFDYVPFYLILEVLNQTMVLKDAEDNIVSFYSGGYKDLKGYIYKNDGSNVVTPFVTFPWHFILDPRIGFIPKHTLQKVGFTFPSTVSTGYNENDITDICINVDYALSTLNSVCQGTEITDQTILNFIKNLLAGIQDSAGHLNQFDLHYDEDEFKFFIIDRNITPPGNTNATLDVVGLGSYVEGINLSSRLTSKITSAVAISAQAANTDVGDELFAMQKWNSGLIDRIVKDRGYEKAKQSDNTNDISYNNTIEISRLFKYIREIEGGKTWTLDSTLQDKGSTDISGLKTLHRRLMHRLQNNTTLEKKQASPGLIPLTLQLKMLGIGKFKVGQVFHLPDALLPLAYRGEVNNPTVGFMVFDPAHTILNGRWVTDLRCGMVMTKKEEGEGIPVDVNEEYLQEFTDIQNSNLQPITEGKARKDVSTYTATSQAGVDLIKTSEGFRPEAYADPGSGNKPITIGYGTTKINGQPVLPGQVIDEAYATRLLKNDIRVFEKAVKSYVTAPVSQGEFDALVSFTYNCGPGNLAASSLLKYLNAGDYESASLEFTKWNKAAGKVLPGLTKRRLKEADMFRTS